jgi:DNA-binding transcriptional ArsR family regulator
MLVPEVDLGRAAEILKTVAHPLRLRILSLLCAHEESVGALAERLAARPAAVSQALAILRQERLVAVTRLHRRACYRVDEPGLRTLIPWIERTLARRPARDPGRAVVRSP